MEFVKIGKINKPVGRDGDLKLEVDEPYLVSVSKAKFLWIKLDGKPIPFSISKFHNQNSVTVKLDEVDSPEEANKYANKEAYLIYSDIKTRKAKLTSSFENIIGFDVFDQDKFIGEIEEVSLYPQQWMATVINNRGKHFLIPLIETFIIDISITEKKILMNLPEGILDL